MLGSSSDEAEDGGVRVRFGRGFGIGFSEGVDEISL
jgi:hypothetical protein